MFRLSSCIQFQSPRFVEDPALAYSASVWVRTPEGTINDVWLAAIEQRVNADGSISYVWGGGVPMQLTPTWTKYTLDLLPNTNWWVAGGKCTGCCCFIENPPDHSARI